MKYARINYRGTLEKLAREYKFSFGFMWALAMETPSRAQGEIFEALNKKSSRKT
jgi:hypothetical protein